MKVSVPASERRSFFPTALNAYLASIFLLLLRFGTRNARSSENWTIGDWLINYHAGFVRRGLLGEAFVAAAGIVHLPAPWLVLTLQLTCYLSLLLVFRRLVLDSSRAPWIVALVISPATLSFPLFNAVSGYRKEILFFATLAILIYLLLYRKISGIWVSIYLSLALPIIVLSHESTYFYIPYYFAALLIALGSWRRAWLIFAVPALLSTAAFLAVSTHLGNLAVARGVCLAAGYPWQGESVGPCGGAIFSLSITQRVAHAGLLLNLAARPFYKLYPLLALLAILPVLIGICHLRHFPSLRSSLSTLAGTVFFSGCLSLLIFYYAVDWGRFIYMHAVAAALLILMVEWRKQRDPQISEAESGLRREWRDAPAWGLLAIYACCWDLAPIPDLAYSSPPLGMIWLVHTMDREGLSKTFLGPLTHHET